MHERVTIYKQVFIGEFVYDIWQAHGVPVESIRQVEQHFYNKIMNLGFYSAREEKIKVEIFPSMTDYQVPSEHLVSREIPYVTFVKIKYENV